MDQFDIRLDHHVSDRIQLFGRYSFVDTSLFRPAPLPGLAEGSFNDAFGSSDNRSQGVAAGLTWTFSRSFVGDLRVGWTRGNYFTYPPSFGVDGPAEIGLTNSPNDPTIAGGLPKINITPRAWNPRATFSLHQGRHFIKFGTEYLQAGTKIKI